MRKENQGDNAAIDTKWTMIEEHQRERKPVPARIVKATLQYMLVDVDGVPGVVETPPFDYAPLGQRRHDRDYIKRHLDLLCGRRILLEIVELDRRRERLLLKPHIYMFDIDNEQKDTVKGVLSKLLPGDIQTVVVKHLGPLSATVDMGGIDGMIPLYYISRAPVYHTRKILRLNQAIEAMVLDVSERDCELSLVHAQMFEAAHRRLRPGEVRQGRIVSLRADGIYLDLGDIIGMVPVDLAIHGYITHPADLYYRGQEMTVRVDYVTAEFMPVVSPVLQDM